MIRCIPVSKIVLSIIYSSLTLPVEALAFITFPCGRVCPRDRKKYIICERFARSLMLLLFHELTVFSAMHYMWWANGGKTDGKQCNESKSRLKMFMKS